MFIYQMKFLDIYINVKFYYRIYWTKYYDNASVAAKAGNDRNVKIGNIKYIIREAIF